MELSSKKIKVIYQGEPIYSVDKEKRTVTCVLMYKISIPSLKDDTGVDPNVQWWKKPSAHVHPYTGSLMHVRSRALYDGKSLKVIGRAVCSPDDEFNEEIGKKIALTKAENKAYANTLCIIDAAVTEITSVYTELIGIFAERMIKVVKSNDKYLEKLTGDKIDTMKGLIDNSTDNDIPYEVIDKSEETPDDEIDIPV